jgi:hypothetical protein
MKQTKKKWVGPLHVLKYKYVYNVGWMKYGIWSAVEGAWVLMIDRWKKHDLKMLLLLKILLIQKHQFTTNNIHGWFLGHWRISYV